MPLYEYQCAQCRRKVEVIQSFSDPAPAKCLHCGGTLAKLLSSPAFQFKGSGFYATDYRGSGGKPEDSPKEKEGDSNGKDGDSSKVKEGGEGAAREAGAGDKGDSLGDGTKESGKESSKGSTKDDGAAAASEGSSRKASTAPSRKDTKRK